MGHTTATFAQVQEAVDAGADLATHLFNGMDPWHHRDARRRCRTAAFGGAGARDGRAHRRRRAPLRRHRGTVLDLVGVDNVAFVSDAMAAAGVGDGSYVLGGLPVVVADGVARLARDPDGTTPGSIAGGTSHVADIVARAVAAGTPTAVCRPCRIAHPRPRARAGSTAVPWPPGARADLVVLDADGPADPGDETRALARR